MKLLLIGPYPIENNGMSHYIDQIQQEWKRQGHTVFTETLYFWKYKATVFRWLSLRKRLGEGFDAVLIQHTPTASGPLIALFLRAAKKAGIPVWLEGHETPETYSRHLPAFLRGLFNAYESQAYNSSRGCLVHTNFHREALTELGVQVPITVIPLPVYGASSVPPAAQCGADWGYYGMISPKKGVDLLLQAYQLSPPGHFPRLHILGKAAPGNQDYVAGLKKSVRPEYSEHILFAGYIPDEKLAEAMAELAWMIFPYRWVSQSAALAQTCFYGIPYLAADIPFFKDFHGQFGCGRLFTADSVAALHQALQALQNAKGETAKFPFENLRNELSLSACVSRQIHLFSSYTE